jgi:ribosomal-protein-alanine N-acetyltransferase
MARSALRLLRSGPGDDLSVVRASRAQNVLIRALVDDELPGALMLCQRCFSLPYTWHHLAHYRRRSRDGFFVAEVEGAMAGFLIAIAPPIGWLAGWSGEVVLVAVDEEHRRLGIGRALMERAFTYFRTKRLRFARLHVDTANDGAAALYRRLGMSVEHIVPRYYRDGADAYRMVKRL